MEDLNDSKKNIIETTSLNTENSQYHTQTACIVDDSFLIIKGIKDNKSYATAPILNNGYGTYALLDKLGLHTSLSIPLNIKKASKLSKNWYKYRYKYTWQERDFEAYVLLKESMDKSCMVSINPSDFPNYNYLITCVRSVFNNKEGIDWAIVTRLDCSVDVLRPFEEEIRGADFGLKRNYRAHFLKQKMTGVYAGRDPKNEKYQVTVYDKFFKSKGNFPVTRYEVNSYPRNLILRDLNRVCSHRPFKSVTRHSIELIKSVNAKFLTFATLLSVHGFWLTKKTLNKSGNFKRTYSKYFTLEKLYPDLNKIFQESIKHYFTNETGD